MRKIVLPTYCSYEAFLLLFLHSISAEKAPLLYKYNGCFFLHRYNCRAMHTKCTFSTFWRCNTRVFLPKTPRIGLCINCNTAATFFPVRKIPIHQYMLLKYLCKVSTMQYIRIFWLYLLLPKFWFHGRTY